MKVCTQCIYLHLLDEVLVQLTSVSVIAAVFTCSPAQLNVAFPATGCQKLIEIDDEHRV